MRFFSIIFAVKVNFLSFTELLCCAKCQSRQHRIGRQSFFRFVLLMKLKIKTQWQINKRKWLPVGQCRAPVKFPHNIGLSVSSSSNIQFVVSFIHLLFSAVTMGARQPNDQPMWSPARRDKINVIEIGEEKEKDKLVRIVFGTLRVGIWTGIVNIFYSTRNSNENFNVIINWLENRQAETAQAYLGNEYNVIDLCSPTRTIIANVLLSFCWIRYFQWNFVTFTAVVFYLHFPLVLCSIPAVW